jgi:hypothetical protein
MEIRNNKEGPKTEEEVNAVQYRQHSIEIVLTFGAGDKQFH